MEHSSTQRFSRFFCRLKDPAQERAFEDSVWPAHARQIRIGLGIWATIFMVSLAVEFLRIRQGDAFVWGAAGAPFPIVCGLLILASSRQTPGALMAWGMVAAAGTFALGGAVMILGGGLPWQDYAATTAMAAVFCSVFVPQRVPQAMLSATLIIGGHLGLLPFADGTGDGAWLVVAEGVVLVTCIFLIRRSALARRHAYLQNLNLELVRENTQASLSEAWFHRQTFEDAAADNVSVMEELAIAREDAQRQASFLEAVLDNISQGVCVFDSDLKLSAWNEFYADLQQLPAEFLQVGVPLEKILLFNAERGEYGQGDAAAIVAARMRKVSRRATIRAHKYERRRPSGQMIEVQGNPMPGGGLVSTYTDITERKRAEEAVRRMAMRDPLTGIANRNAFNRHLEKAVNDVCDSGDAFALALFDLDDFKPVNDRFGHPVGDMLLCHAARVIAESIRDDDIAARLGGDEFAIILKKVRHADLAEELVGRIVRKLSDKVTLDGNEIRIGASAGISVCTAGAQSAEEIISSADTALYAAKAGGKNQLKLAAV